MTRNIRRSASFLGVLLVLLFVAGEVGARGRGGGRGGGRMGGSRAHVSRSGPASGGTFGRGSMGTGRHRDTDFERGRRGGWGDDRRSSDSYRRDRRERSDREHHGDGHHKGDGHDHKKHHHHHDDVYYVGAVITPASYASLSCTSSTVYAGGVTYYNCGSTWYNRSYRAGSVSYVVVDAPPGY